MSGTKVISADGAVAISKGFAAGAVRANIKQTSKPSTKPDFGLIFSDTPCTAAGVFTTNNVRAACVDWSRSHLPSAAIRAIVCNSGNANACTGKQGHADVARTAKLAADALGITVDSVLVASTGVIGRPMPMEKIAAAVPALAASKGNSRAHGGAFAHAIMTTDLVRKESVRTVVTPKGRYTIGGCAKGSGMIHPNMATMLAFVTTDAAVDKQTLAAMVKRVADRTFNNLTVDGDTSTNDMLLVVANGASGVTVSAKLKIQFEQALLEVCDELCAAIAADGEGATKRVEIRVKGGKSFADARKAAKAIANSNLVKTALFGNDPNWGRILCAIGYSGASFSDSRVKVAIGKLTVCKALRPVAFDAARMQKTLRSKVVPIHVDLGEGAHEAVAHTCDLTYDYIKINAEYTT